MYNCIYVYGETSVINFTRLYSLYNQYYIIVRNSSCTGLVRGSEHGNIQHYYVLVRQYNTKLFTVIVLCFFLALSMIYQY